MTVKTTATAVESSLSGLSDLAGLRHRLEVEGYSEDLAATARERVESLPADAPEVCRAFGAEVLKRVDSARGKRSLRPIVEHEPGELPGPGEEATVIGPEGVVEEARPGHLRAAAAARPTSAYDREVQAIAALGVRLPLRARAVEVPGHVEPLPETHGLVHGGIVQARGFRLVVKAYRFHELKRQADSSYHHVEVVAGVCDRFDAQGRLAGTWSTAERLGSWYASTSVALPPPPCVFAAGGSHGFYRPANWVRWILSNGLKPPAAPPEDSGLPDPLLYTGKVLREGKSTQFCLTGFRAAPPPAASLENALFMAGGGGSAGFLIDTPYVSVFSLGPDSAEVLVTLPRVFRDATIRKDGAVSRMDRKDRWEARLFTA